MTRLLVLVEGQTEETFVNEVLAPHLYRQGYAAISARLFGNARQRSRRGGIRSWRSAERDIVRHLKEDREVAVALMVDYYGLPRTGEGAWPGRSAHEGAVTVETSLSGRISELLGDGFDPRRFLPCVMMHEFEAMLFSDCTAFGRAIDRPEVVPSLLKVRELFPSPEEIDDTPDGAPSKRIERLVPEYEKPIMGNAAALEIGLDRIRAECPHFRNWLERLETRTTDNC